MAFTYGKVNFLNNSTYTEITHAEALACGWPNFIGEGFDYNEITQEITNGFGMNGGLPIVLGRPGEAETITLPGSNFYIVLHTILNGSSSTSLIETMSAIPNNTSTDKYFGLYSLDSSGVILEDYRHSSMIKTVEIVNIGDDEFKLVINGTDSNAFSTSVLQNAFTRTESVKIFRNVCRIEDNFADSDFAGVTSIAELLDILVRSTTMEYDPDNLYSATDSVDYTCATASYTNFWRIVDTHLGLNVDDVGLFVWEKRNLESAKAKSTLSITYPAINRTYHYLVNNGEPQYTVMLANATFDNVTADVLTSDTVETNAVHTYSANAVTAAIESTLSTYRIDATNMVSTNVTANKITSTGAVNAQTVNATNVEATNEIWAEGLLGSTTGIETPEKVTAYGFLINDASMNLIGGNSANSSGTEPWELLNLEYNTGGRMASIGKTDSTDGAGSIYLRHYTKSTGEISAALGVGFDTTNKVVHTVAGVNHKLAYMSDISTRSLSALELAEQQAEINLMLAPNEEILEKQKSVNKQLNNEIVEMLTVVIAEKEEQLEQTLEAKQRTIEVQKTRKKEETKEAEEIAKKEIEEFNKILESTQNELEQEIDTLVCKLGKRGVKYARKIKKQ